MMAVSCSAPSGLTSIINKKMRATSIDKELWSKFSELHRQHPCLLRVRSNECR